jgi:hypothetical protein
MLLIIYMYVLCSPCHLTTAEVDLTSGMATVGYISQSTLTCYSRGNKRETLLQAVDHKQAVHSAYSRDLLGYTN